MDKPTQADIQNEILLRQIEEAKKQFDELDRLDVRSIPEGVFLHHFLPYFAGEKTENMQEIVSNWLTIAGSPMHPVNIVNVSGDVVAQVPPINNNNSLDPSIDKKSNLSYAMKEAKAMSDLSPIAAQNIITEELSNKLQKITSTTNTSNEKATESWNSLFKHYSKKTIGEPENKQVTTNDTGDVFGF